MVCIYCGDKTEVTNSRQKARLPSVWRRRACKACVAQFTTVELPDYETSLTVSSNQHFEAFSRDKLFLSLHKSLGHRPKALNDATALTTTVIARVLKLTDESQINQAQLAKASYEVLKRFDVAAAANYKAYHRASLTS